MMVPMISTTNRNEDDDSDHLTMLHIGNEPGYAQVEPVRPRSHLGCTGVEVTLRYTLSIPGSRPGPHTGNTQVQPRLHQTAPVTHGLHRVTHGLLLGYAKGYTLVARGLHPVVPWLHPNHTRVTPGLHPVTPWLHPGFTPVTPNVCSGHAQVMSKLPSGYTWTAPVATKVTPGLHQSCTQVAPN